MRENGLNLPSAPNPEILKQNYTTEKTLGIAKRDKQDLDRWHRNEGRTDHDQAKEKILGMNREELTLIS